MSEYGENVEAKKVDDSKESKNGSDCYHYLDDGVTLVYTDPVSKQQYVLNEDKSDWIPREQKSKGKTAFVKGEFLMQYSSRYIFKMAYKDALAFRPGASLGTDLFLLKVSPFIIKQPFVLVYIT